MIYKYYTAIESIALDISFAFLFFLIGMAIKDVLKQGNVPIYGQRIVWLVLTLGCMGFVIKGVIKLSFEGNL